jgi:mutual gliding-motility protein MglA
MVLFNYSTRELTAKIVFYGPGLCGKTTNLQYIHENLPGEVKGKMLSLATKTDRTLFFDFLPIDLGEIRGMKTRVQLYTVPGQVFYNETRKLVLKGADGIVFVADSQETMIGANVESFKNLEENLKAHGMKLGEMPHVIQFNKRDLPKLSSIEDLNAALNKFNAPFYESVATTGIGVQDTLKAIVKLVLLHLTKKYDPKAVPASARGVAAAPVAVAPPTPAVAAAAPVPAAEAPRSIPVARVASPEPAEAAVGAVAPLSSRAGTSRSSERVPPPAPSPRSGRSAGREPVESMPAFADDEIDGLVDEVEEIEAPAAAAEGFEPLSAPVAASPVVMPEAEATSTDDGIWLGSPEEDGSAYGFNTSIEDLLAKEPVDVGHDAPAAPEPPAWSPSAASGSEFEIDKGFDPDWTPEPTRSQPGPPDLPPRAATARPEPPPPVAPPVAPPVERAPEPEQEPEGDAEPAFLDAPIAPFPIPIEEDDEPTAASPPPPDPEPIFEPGAERGEDPVPDLVLTEVAEDDDLFNDPGLEVAHLEAGQAREIVVPVLLGAGPSARRFKLAIRLRLDPID